MNVIITGAAKGIGLELCRIALEKGFSVCAVSRSPENSSVLLELQDKYQEKLICLKVNIATESAGDAVSKKLADWNSVDILINNAGVLDQAMNEEALLRSFHVNAVAPLLMTQGLLPKLKNAKHPIVAQITSRMGSISETSSGGYYGYRASKAALNMFNKCLSVEHPWLTAIVIHPGWVKTDMGGKSAPVQPRDSAQGVWQVIQGVKDKSESGKFFDYQGAEIPY